MGPLIAGFLRKKQVVRTGKLLHPTFYLNHFITGGWPPNRFGWPEPTPALDSGLGRCNWRARDQGMRGTRRSINGLAAFGQVSAVPCQGKVEMPDMGVGG
jgi:hypothetical protein